MKKFLLTFTFLILILVATVWAVGTWFLLDEFSTNDAAPLADPITTSHGESVDVVDVESKMSVSSGYLNVPAQTTVADGEEGLRYATTASRYAGRTAFFKIKYSTLANSTTGGTEEASSSNFFGWTVAGDITSGNNTVTLRANAASFLWKFAETCGGSCTQVGQLIMVPTTADSFYVAIALGGRDGANWNVMRPWYSGVTNADYTEGAFLWIKKNINGQWLLQGCYNDSLLGGTNRFAHISNFNSVFTVDRWAVSNDTLRSLMQPIEFISGIAADNTQIFDITPEVGVSFDSLKGNFTVTSNQFNAVGADPGTPNWITTFSCSDDDVYIEMMGNFTDANDDCSIILRRDPGDGSFVLAQYARAANNVRVLTFDGTSTFTTRATSGAFTYTAGLNFLAAAIVDSTVEVWAGSAASTIASIRWVGTTVLTNIGSNNHGMRLSDTSTDLRQFRAYPIGTDNEYTLLTQYFGDTVNRGRIIMVQ